jgi:hypothetical protein
VSDHELGRRIGRIDWRSDPIAWLNACRRGGFTPIDVSRLLDEQERDDHIDATVVALLNGQLEAANWHLRQLARLLRQSGPFD